MSHLSKLLHLIIIQLLKFAIYSNATEIQCKLDCNSPTTKRIVGPTRPWHELDALQNTLSLTRPYPYTISSKTITIITFQVGLRLHMPKFSSNQHGISEVERQLIVTIVRELLKEYYSTTVEYLDETPLAKETNIREYYEYFFVDYSLSIESISEHNGYNYKTTDDFVRNELFSLIDNSVSSGNLTALLATYTTEMEKLHNATVGFASSKLLKDSGNYTKISKLGDDYINPYSKFCELGCTLFFSSNNIPVKVRDCFDQCDQTYNHYDGTENEYNDLVQTARLECRDGCLIALMRCQPGYFCEQMAIDKGISNENESNNSSIIKGGEMWPCPKGTYRDVSHDSVEKCLDCPAGRYRENTKGRNLDSCTKCPVGRYVQTSRSTSILDCMRCPAGRFNTETGAGHCNCITSDACKEEQLPCPADAEKRDTIPFIGRW